VCLATHCIFLAGRNYSPLFRAWHVNGLAIRFAQTLGLNLRNDVQEFDEVEKELRIRIWYALYSVEHLLCFMTGRPASIRDKDCSVPMPRAFDGELSGMDLSDVPHQPYSEDATMTPSTGTGSNSNQNSVSIITPTSSTQPGDSNPRTPTHSTSSMNQLPAGQSQLKSAIPPIASSSLSSLSAGLQFNSGYFLEHTKLNRITAEVLTSLYSPDTIHKSWSDIQGTISQLELEIVKWRADLPPIWDFGKRHRNQTHAREVSYHVMSCSYMF
jgi:hypothetical protein